MSPDAHAAGLIVFLRCPKKGNVKTRLAATVGDDAALIIYQQLIAITQENARRTGLPVFLFYDGGLPPDSERDLAFSYHHQSPGNLGQKMFNAISIVLEQHLQAIIIGSDCPDLQPEFITEASSLLTNHDVALGPATDGGYYLIGCKKAYPFLFDKITWGTPAVFAQTIEVIKKNYLTSGLLPVLSDIDTEEDWNSFSGK